MQTSWIAPALGYLLEDRCARIAARLNDLQGGGVRLGRAQQGIVPLDVLNFFLRKWHPALMGITKEASMQTTIAQSHTSSLFILLEVYFLVYIKLEHKYIKDHF
jgi:hypothetical protein